MKRKIIVLRQGNRLYLKDIDIKELKPLLKLANIEVHTTEQGKYTGAPRHYIPMNTGLSFILSLTSDYIIEIHSKSS